MGDTEELRSAALWRWLTFVMGMVLASGAGTLYAFGVYNKEIVSIMSYDAQSINLVQSLGAVGQYFGVPGGALYDKWGVRAALTYSIILASGGYLGMWSLLKWKWSSEPVVMGLFYMCVGQGSSAMYMPGLKQNVINMPAARRGVVIGLLAAGFGMSSGLWTGVYGLFFKPSGSAPDVQNFLFTIAMFIAGADLIGMVMIRNVGPPPLAPASTPALGATKVQEGEAHEVRLVTSDSGDSDSDSPMGSSSPAGGGHPPLSTPLLSKAEVDITGLELLRKKEFWVLFFLFGLGSGAGLMLIGNVSLLAESNRFSDSDSLLLLVILSICNCLGRIIVGGFADRTSERFSNSFWLALTCTVTGGAHVLLMIMQSHLLFVGCILDGLAYGGLFAIVPKLLSERFGTKSFGFNFSIITLALAAGNMGLNQVTGKIYDSHASYQPAIDKRKCYGEECFRMSFVVTSACCGIAMLLCIVLSRMTKKPHHWF